MDPSRLWKAVLTGSTVVGLAVLTAVLAFPLTRPLAIGQIQWQLAPARPSAWAYGLMGVCDGVIDYAPGYRPPSDKHWAAFEAAVTKAAQARPGDPAIQIAAAAIVGPYDGTPKRVQAVAERFPHTPSLIAVDLAFQTQGFDITRLEADFGFGSTGPSASSGQHTSADTTQKAQRILQLAVQGERADPQNAYFPAMKAGALFALHQDTQALEALEEAARKPRWYDYQAGFLQGAWDLVDSAAGYPNVLDRNLLAPVPTSGYGVMIRLSRIAAALATRMERSGDKQGGLAIRSALVRLGALMRWGSTSLIGSKLGDLVAASATYGPGGHLSIPPPGADALRAQKERWDAYLSYLRQNGWRREQGDAQRQREAAAVVDGLPLLGRSDAVGHESWAALAKWPWSIALLAAIFYLAGLALICSALALLARHRPGGGLPREAWWGMVIGVGITTALSAPFWPETANVQDALRGFTLALVVGGLGAAVLQRWHIAATAAAGVATEAVIVGAFLWQAPALGSPAMDFGIAAQRVLLVIPAVVVLAGAVALLRRIPITEATVRLVPPFAAVAAALLACVWAGCIWRTAALDHRAVLLQNQSLPQEGPFVAKLMNKSWPGPPRQFELAPRGARRDFDKLSPNGNHEQAATSL